MSDTSALGSALRRALPKLDWRIENFAIMPDAVTIFGWALPPRDCPATFTLNGRPFEDVRFLPAERPDIASIYWFWPGSDRPTFECRTKIDSGFFSSGHAVLEYANRETGQPLSRDNGVFWPPSIQSIEPIPDAEAIRRVTGHDRPDWFLQNGYTTYARLKAVLESLAGGWPEGQTLDWGCGCGRVTRWLLKDTMPGTTVVGADIDPVSVRWCRDHLDRGAFEEVPLHPPTSFAPGQFSVVLAISVFTHLREQTQFQWLEELARIVRPGGLVLATTHGQGAVCKSNPTDAWYSSWLARGFSDDRRDRALEGIVADREYYRASFHTVDYVRREWSRYFEIVDVIEAFTHSFQDLVVLRRTS